MRSIRRLGSTYTVDTVIFDESGLYGTTYDVDDVQIRTISTQAALESITGQFTFIIPARSLISENWLLEALNYMLERQTPAIIRPQLHLTWGEDIAPSIFDQTQNIDPLYHLCNPVYSGVLSMPTTLFMREAREAATPGRRDQLVQGLTWLGYTHTCVDQTAAFTHVPLSAGAEDYFGLSIFDFAHTREAKIAPPESMAATQAGTASRHSYLRARSLAVSGLRRLRLLGLAKKIIHKKKPSLPPLKTSLPDWLITEWRQLHRIENRIFPSRYLVSSIRIHNLPPHDAQLAALLYSQTCRQLSNNHYDYIFFVPWLQRGGADKFVIEYANTIHALRPSLGILVVTTLPADSEWADKLDQDIDFCNMGDVLDGKPESLQQLLLELLVRQSNASVLHVINSALGYEFVRKHKQWLAAKMIKVVATSFSQEVLPDGQIIGYSHMNVPKIYEQATVITSDNDAVLNMWCADYGFDRRKLALHHLPYPITGDPIPLSSKGNEFHVLWASRLCPEKLPSLVNEIGLKLQGKKVIIDMYGTASPYFDITFLQRCPSNVHYKGSFSGLSTLPLMEYDAFLYTSLFDGMPNTLLEVGSSGLPIVSSAVGGIPELIEDGTTGLLVTDVHDSQAYADALIRLKNDSQLCENLAAHLRERIAKRYSTRQFKESVKKMLQDLGV